jgi:hypothetical protein
MFYRRHDAQYNDTQYKEIQHNSAQHERFFATLSITGPQHNSNASYDIECCNAECGIFCYPECHFAERHFAECHFADCIYAEYFYSEYIYSE